ncbi:MAG: HI0074 family nucleotidyltransferase substrate-binding subunit [Bacteroidota bacterium]|nr:HI0074 family nucleotidyltransferase substrate-binding subunit [Bacteroidota bacterium]
MSDEFNEKFNDFEQATINLSSVFLKEYNELERDGLIKRFELTFETCWKVLKAYITEIGLQKTKSPKETFKSAFSLNIIEDEFVWEEIIQFRNLAVHTYNKGLAEDIVHELPRLYPEFKKILDKLKILTNK